MWIPLIFGEERFFGQLLNYLETIGLNLNFHWNINGLFLYYLDQGTMVINWCHWDYLTGEPFLGPKRHTVVTFYMSDSEFLNW